MAVAADPFEEAAYQNLAMRNGVHSAAQALLVDLARVPDIVVVPELESAMDRYLIALGLVSFGQGGALGNRAGIVSLAYLRYHNEANGLGLRDVGTISLQYLDFGSIPRDYPYQSASRASSQEVFDWGLAGMDPSHSCRKAVRDCF